jgi:ataxia telangiectasia mutated family protein
MLVLIAAVLIASTKVADRNAGLKDLVHILKHNRGKPSLEILGNKAYLALCETLFQCMRDERSTLLRSKSKAARPSALLPLSANALRHVINSGVRAIKTSTVEMIIDTIVELLPGKDGVLIKPLVEDLPKTLRALLEYQPHVERLSKECWEATVEFCIESLSTIFAEADAEPSNSWSTGVSSRGPTPFESTDGGRRPSQRNTSSKLGPISQELIRAAEDLVYCLQFLVKASNSPVLEKADSVLLALVSFLQQKAGRAKAAGLAAINSILPRITLHAAQLTEQVIQQLLPLMKTMWSDLLLRDEIMTTLIYTEAHIASILISTRDDTFSFELEALVEIIYSDYRRRQETTAHQYLEDDCLCFRGLGDAQHDAHPLNTCAFSLETDQVRYEGLWATVATISHFSYLLDQRRRKLAQDLDNEEESMIKRLRVSHHFHDYLRHVSEPRSNAKRAALQVVAFMAQEGCLDEEDLQSVLERLIPCISDTNPVHSSWAMIGLAT